MTPNRIRDEWVIERLDRIWPDHTEAFTRFLISLRRQFAGDLDAALILSAVSIGTRSEGWQNILLGEGIDRESSDSGTNTQSIAHVTGIPRESARRKLALLQAKGWVTRDADGNWRPTAQAAADLRPATWATISYLRTIFAAALDEAGTTRR